MVAAFSQDIFVVLSLPYAPEVYLHCWNLLKDYPSQAKTYLTDIRQVRGGANVWKGPIVDGRAGKCSKAVVREGYPLRT